MQRKALTNIRRCTSATKTCSRTLWRSTASMMSECNKLVLLRSREPTCRSTSKKRTPCKESLLITNRTKVSRITTKMKKSAKVKLWSWGCLRYLDRMTSTGRRSMSSDSDQTSAGTTYPWSSGSSPASSGTRWTSWSASSRRACSEWRQAIKKFVIWKSILAREITATSNTSKTKRKISRWIRT